MTTLGNRGATVEVALCLDHTRHAFRSQVIRRNKHFWLSETMMFNALLLKGPPQLFDLSTDIGEKHNLAGEKPEIAKQLQEKFDAWNATLMKPRWGQKAKFQEDDEADTTQPTRKERRQQRQAPKSATS